MMASNDAPSPGVKRSRSVQFSAPHSPMSSSPLSDSFSPHQTQHHAESSADEITPIIPRERGGGHDYNTSAAPDEHSGGEPVAVDSRRRSSATGPRQRKKSNGNRRRSTQDADGDDSSSVGWWNGFLEKFGSVELDNKGSVARDHLALERTFLAWLRTSLAFASIGIAVTQLFRLNTAITDREGLTPEPSPPGTIKLRQVGKPLGATFLGIAILVLAVGGRRYFESQYWIIRGKFPASRGSVFLITFVAAALIVTSLIVVITIDPTLFEKR